MHVLLTGGCGFIGANLVPRLLASGSSVRVLDDLRTGNERYLAGLDAEVIRKDILDARAVEEALRDVDAVVHLAATGSVVDSVANPVANFQANAQGTLVVLEAARRAGIQRLVFSSTGGALIGDVAPPVSEQSLPKPISPYGASKLAAEGYCHAFWASYGIRTISTRFANIYGPYSGHKKGAVTAFFRALHIGEPIVIYGDGRASRDFMYVDDVCAGIESCLTADVVGGTVLHLATGVETSVTELADACRRVAAAPEHPIEYRPARRGEVARNFATYDCARELIGFEPKVALTDGLRSTWQWYEQFVF